LRLTANALVRKIRAFPKKGVVELSQRYQESLRRRGTVRSAGDTNDTALIVADQVSQATFRIVKVFARSTEGFVIPLTFHHVAFRLFDFMYGWETKYSQQMILPVGESRQAVAAANSVTDEEWHGLAKSRWNAMNQRSRAQGHSIPTDVSLSPGSRLLPHISSSANDSAIGKAVLHSL
ncbi:hypothetical protein FCULG_00005739, partial [Fusarium culmorum]